MRKGRPAAASVQPGRAVASQRVQVELLRPGCSSGCSKSQNNVMAGCRTEPANAFNGTNLLFRPPTSRSALGRSDRPDWLSLWLLLAIAAAAAQQQSIESAAEI